MVHGPLNEWRARFSVSASRFNSLLMPSAHCKSTHGSTRFGGREIIPQLNFFCGKLNRKHSNLLWLLFINKFPKAILTSNAFLSIIPIVAHRRQSTEESKKQTKMVFVRKNIFHSSVVRLPCVLFLLLFSSSFATRAKDQRNYSK